MFSKSAVTLDARKPRSVCVLGFSISLFTANDPSGELHAKLHVCRKENLRADHKEFCLQVVRDWAVLQPLEVVRATRQLNSSQQSLAIPANVPMTCSRVRQSD